LRKVSVTFLWLLPAFLFFSEGPRAQWKTHWSYDDGPEGPSHWGDLDPAYAACRDGKQQSPIDIGDAQKAHLAPIRFEYKSGPLKIINNGYTAVRVNYSNGNGNFLVVGDTRYELTQFHFHRPSEEWIEGKASDMVIHLMHQSKDGKVAGVAILLKSGGANSTIQQLWGHMPATAGPEHEIAGVEINPAGLVPRATSYYRYEGSVTAPPCTEGVTWYVLKTPMTISAAQISAFAKLYPHDVRPVQPLNGRLVQQTE
jgi:carbonic anhydrase